MEFLILVMVSVSAACLFMIAFDIRTILQILRSSSRSCASAEPMVAKGASDHHSFAPPGVFIVWEWRDGQWMTRNQSDAVSVGMPPAYPGAFSGDTVRTWVSSATR